MAWSLWVISPLWRSCWEISSTPREQASNTSGHLWLNLLRSHLKRLAVKDEDSKLEDKCVSWALFFFFFNGHICSVWKFPGKGSNRSCSCQPMPQPQQCQIWAMSVTYIAAHGNTGSSNRLSKVKDCTCFLVDTSQFLTCWATVGTPQAFSNVETIGSHLGCDRNLVLHPSASD